jgi:phosphatidylserine/phosphatidylglycerophosphate/cardiolipin synthase-like enzyme
MKKKRLISASLFCVALWCAIVGFYQTHKSLPEDLDYRGEEYLVAVSNIDFLHDLSWVDEKGHTHHEQEIFDTLFALIEGAERYILVDMFLFNSYGGKDAIFYKDLSTRLTELLVHKKKTMPGIDIDFITDPINTVYGGSESSEIEQLKSVGVNVIITGLEGLRDSNFIYSSLWRTFLQWFGNSKEGGWLPHPFSPGDDKVTLRSYLRLLNFKANHRKIVVVDSGDDMATMVASANPHGGSSAHSNVALVVRGPLWRSVYQTEAAVAALSGSTLSGVSRPIAGPQRLNSPAASGRVRILTEQQIKNGLLTCIDSAVPADSLKIAQFYLADRDIVEALIDAAAKGVEVKIVLDPNKDAFGYEKNGIPNRQTGYELIRRSAQKIQLRWYDTHGEQFHSKLFVLQSGGKMTVILGSANLTRRNLDNFNLELDIQLVIDTDTEIARSIVDYFNRIWVNENGIYTLEKEAYEDDSFGKRALYRIQERFGLSTF